MAIYAKDKHAQGEKWVELPFVPAHGDLVTFDGLMLFVERRDYSIDDDELHIVLEPWMGGIGDCRCTSAVNCCKLRIEDWTKDGWEIIETIDNLSWELPYADFDPKSPHLRVI